MSDNSQSCCIFRYFATSCATSEYCCRVVSCMYVHGSVRKRAQRKGVITNDDLSSPGSSWISLKSVRHTASWTHVYLFKQAECIGRYSHRILSGHAAASSARYLSLSSFALSLSLSFSLSRSLSTLPLVWKDAECFPSLCLAQQPVPSCPGTLGGRTIIFPFPLFSHTARQVISQLLLFVLWEAHQNHK